MPDTLLVKHRDSLLLSWHPVHEFTPHREGIWSRCGHSFMVPCPTAEELPMNEKSCESCLRLLRHDQEKAAA